MELIALLNSLLLDFYNLNFLTFESNNVSLDFYNLNFQLLKITI